MSEARLRSAMAVLALAGVAIAGYLTWAHYADAQAFCVAGGGSCEKVRTSEYAELAGVPVALMGVVGYATILATVLIRGEAARLAGALLALIGFGFSVYLTYLELFTIDAICQWCVASAVVMTALAVVACARVWSAE